MTRGEFLGELRAGLTGLRQQDIEDIIADYESHFADGRAAGRSDDDVARALGDPVRLARELRVEAGFKRWQDERSTRNLAGVVLALLGLATIDFMLLLPAAGTIIAIFLGFALAVLGFCIGGVVLLISLLPIGFLADLGSQLGRGLAGAGLIAGGIGGGALFVIVVEWTARMLVKYARLHYRLLTTAAQSV